MTRGLQRIPIAVGSDFQLEPVRANFPDQSGQPEIRLIGFEPDAVNTPAPEPVAVKRGAGMAMADTAYGFAKGAGSLVKGLGWLSGSDTLQNIGQSTEDYWGEKQSDDLKRQLEAVGKAEGVMGTISALWDNPAAIGDYIATSVPMMVPGMGVGAVGARGVAAFAGNAAKSAALRAGASEAAAIQAGKIAAEKAATRFAVGANMAGEGAVSGGVTGAEVEKFALEKGATPEQAKAAANSSALMAGAWTTAGAGIGAGMETRAMLGKLKDTGIKGFAKNVGKEALEEAVQNPGEDYAAYSGKVQFDPAQTFDPGKSATLGAVTGGAMGAGFHAAGRASERMAGKPDEQPLPEDSPAMPESGGMDGEFIAAGSRQALPNLPDTGQTYDQRNTALPSEQFMEGDVLGPETLPAGQRLLPQPPIDGETVETQVFARPALPAPEDGGQSERQITTARGLLNYSPKASPELLARLMGIDSTMAGMLFNHWQASRQAQTIPANAAAPSVQTVTAPLQGEASQFIPDQPAIITPLDVEAHAAATSPLNARPQPTEAQKKAGNYAKGHLRFQGMDISIENPAGSVRSGTDASGKPWRTEMQHHYGYIKGTVGRDKDHLDVFIKPNAKTAKTAYVIDQIDPKTGRFDEHKIVFGADSEADARSVYQANYDADWQGLGAITAMPMDQFKSWLKSGKTKKPIAYAEPKEVRTTPRSRPASDSLIQAIINRGGISRDIMQDVGADPKGRYQPGLFTKGGTADLSELAQLLFDEDGFHQIGQSTDIGPARELEELIARAVKGERILNTEAAEREYRLGMEAEERAEIERLANEYGIALKDGTKRRSIDDIKAEIEDAIAFEIGKAGESWANIRNVALSEGITETELDAVETPIADGYDGDKRQDHMILMYRDLASAIQEKLDDHQQVLQFGDGVRLEEGARTRPDDGEAQTPAEPARATDEGRSEPFSLEIQTAADLKAKVARESNEDLANREIADRERDAFALSAPEGSAAPVKTPTQQSGLFTAAGKASKDAAQDSGATIAGKPVSEMTEDKLRTIARGLSPTYGEAAVDKAKAELRRRTAITIEQKTPADAGVSVSGPDMARWEMDFGIMGKYTYEPANRAPVPEGGKLIASQIIPKKIKVSNRFSTDYEVPREIHAFRVSVVERSNGARYSQVEYMKQDIRRGDKVEATFEKMPQHAIEAREYSSINNAAIKLFEANKPIAADDMFAEKVGAGETATSKGSADSLNTSPAQVKETPVEPQAEGKIDDFGEKLGGARKDKAAALRDAVSRELSDDEIASQPLSKIWPKESIDQIEDPFIAAVAHAARAEIPAKPRKSYYVKGWVEKVKVLRGLTGYMLRGTVSKEQFANKLNEARGLDQFAAKVSLLESIDRKNWDRIGKVEEYPQSYRYGDDGKTQIPSPIVTVEIDGKRQRYDAVSVADVQDKVRDSLGEAPQGKRMEFEVRGTPGRYQINKKGDKLYRKLKTFETTKEAFDYRTSNYDDLVAAWEAVKDSDNVKETERGMAMESRASTGKSDALNLTGDELGGRKPIAELVREAVRIARERFAGKIERNESDGMAIIMGAQGIKHAMSGRVSEISALAMARLGEVIRRAKFVKSEPDKAGRNTIKEVRFYELPVSLDGENSTLRVVVRVASDGNRYYDHFEVEKQTPAGQSGKPLMEDSTQPFAGAVPDRSGTQTIGDVQAEGNTSESRTAAAGDSDTPSVRAINGVVNKFKTQFKGAAALDIRVVRTASEIPARFRPSPYAEGVFHDDAGLIYLVTMNLKDGDGKADTGRAFQVLMHEAVGHYGLAAMMGERFASITKRVKDAARAKGKIQRETESFSYQPGHPDYATVEAVRLRYPDATENEIAQEVLARIAETDPGRTLFGYVRAVVRQWIRDMARALGIDLNITTAELNDLVALASAYMRRGDNLVEDQAPSGLVAASQKVGAGKTAGGMESRRHVSGDSGRQYSAAQKRAFSNVGREIETHSLKERVSGIWQDIGKRMAQGIADQFAPLKDLDKNAYLLARMSKGADGALEAMLMYGKVFISDGVYDVDAKDGGVIDKLLRPLGKEADDFMWWVAGNRAADLAKQGRENLMSAADIQALKDLAKGTLDFDYTLPNGKTTRDRATAYAAAQKVFADFNKSVLDIAEQSGLIDSQARAVWESDFYVPFYRDMEGDKPKFPNVKSGLVRQKAFERLKGGSEKLHSDLLANTVLNWSHLLHAAAKNRAAKAALEAAEHAGVATWVPAAEKDSVAFRDGGEEFHFHVEDPFILDAITAMEFSGFSGPAMKAMGAFKRWLTIGVTASPTFKVRNLIRDSISAIGTTELSYNILKNLKDGAKATARDSQTYASMLASGGHIRFGTMIEGNRADHVRRLVEKGVDPDTILDDESKLKKLWNRRIMPMIDAYNELGDRSENINRAAIYEQLRAKGMSHAEASLAARDLLDFSMGGTWSAVRFLTAVVPFANARIQGLYKLGRAAKDDPKRMGYVVGAVALASLALLAAYHDDDDWKKREDFDRDTYWWFKVGGVAFRIPKPFEIGAIGTLAERSAELLFDKEMDGHRFGERLGKMVTDTFAMNPVPQMFKPLIDLYANKDSFTGRAIETMGMEKMRPEDRYTMRSSEFAKLVGKAGVLSPVQIDHLIRGYFGWLGTAAATTVDTIVRAGESAPRPARELRDMFLIGSFVETLPSGSSRYVTQMYEQSKEIEEAYNSWRHYLKTGDKEKADAIYSDQKDKIQRYGRVSRARQLMSELNAQSRRIETDKNLDADEKRKRLRQIAAQKDKIARMVAQ